MAMTSGPGVKGGAGFHGPIGLGGGSGMVAHNVGGSGGGFAWGQAGDASFAQRQQLEAEIAARRQATQQSQQATMDVLFQGLAPSGFQLANPRFQPIDFSMLAQLFGF